MQWMFDVIYVILNYLSRYTINVTKLADFTGKCPLTCGAPKKVVAALVYRRTYVLQTQTITRRYTFVRRELKIPAANCKTV